MPWVVEGYSLTDRLKRDVSLREWRVHNIFGGQLLYLVTVPELRQLDPDMVLLDLRNVPTTAGAELYKYTPYDMCNCGASTPLGLCTIWAIIDANRESNK